MNCPHTQGHCNAPTEFKAALWQFLRDHPFGVTPEPYADELPATFPDSCVIVEDQD